MLSKSIESRAFHVRKATSSGLPSQLRSPHPPFSNQAVRRPTSASRLPLPGRPNCQQCRLSLRTAAHSAAGISCRSIAATTDLGISRRWLITGSVLLLQLHGLTGVGAAEGDDSIQVYQDKKNKFSLAIPASFEKKDKAGATALFEDPERRSTQVGVTVNPVRIASLTAFGSLQVVGENLLNAERAKESTLECTLLYQQSRTDGSGVVYYEYGYELNSTRGRKNVQTSVTIQDSVLYIINATVKCSKETCNGFEDTIAALREVTSSFAVLL
mmetsp:Transcript_4517/g.12607  ORF Transcript_4517/g.12607 Transcript_4517/m.12607 type:complete len:271 (+) Transcript_4517:89-901(+)